MGNGLTAGERFRQAVDQHRPLQVAGTINAYCALLAQQTGFEAIYLSGAGVANASFGKPDLGVTSRADVVADVRRIAAASETPLLVDIDTGWEEESGGIARTVVEMIDAGAGAVHIEDQVPAKRCGHREGKVLVTCDAMRQRVITATEARTDTSFVVMARTDAYSVEGLDAAIQRSQRYVDAGAEMIFAEAMKDLEDYRRFCQAISVPVLANLTEFGKTPLYTLAEMQEVGVRLVLYPLSAFRAMSKAAQTVYETIRKDGNQQAVLQNMQTRQQLYDVLGYEQHERQLDDQLAKEKDD